MKQEAFKLQPKKFFYCIQEKVAEGLSADVYKALKEHSQYGPSQTLALKVFKSKKDIQRWRKEFHFLSRISSPYCVQLFGWEILEDSKLALLLEWIEGIHLNDLFLMEELSLDEIQNLCFQIHEGLKDLKNKNSFHGDLNPFNVLINTSGRIKLIDFGMVWPSFKKSELKNKSVSIQGTLKFIAPEVLKGHPPSYFSDLYSLGALIKFLSSSQSVFFSENLDFIHSCLHLVPHKRKALFHYQDKNNIETKLSHKVRKILKKKKIQSQVETRTKKLPKINSFDFRDSKTLSNKTIALSSIALSEKFFKLKKLFYSYRTLIFIFLLFIKSSSFFKKQSTLIHGMESKKEGANLIISTHHWFEISINGKKKGYSPLNLKNIQPGILLIRAKSIDKTYVKKIEIGAKEKMILNDDFFNSNLSSTP